MRRAMTAFVEHARGALLGTFVGDALGMPFEGAPPGTAPKSLEMEEARLGRGTYTDDTQMMIALAESLIEHGEVIESQLARAFLASYESERGYGGGTRRVLDLWRGGAPVEVAAGQVFGGQGSRGNGAAMRIAPVAVRFAGDQPRLSDQAFRSARITHAHPVGIDGAVVQAAAIAAALRGDDILGCALAAASTSDLRAGLTAVSDLLGAQLPPADVASQLGSSSDAADSVPAAIYTAVAHRDFELAVGYAVRLGGDTDTVAAMTGAITGARDGAETIPLRWLDALEDGERGRSYVEALVPALLEH